MMDTERGWLAGMIDGEGSITFDRIGSWRRPGLSVSSTDIELLDELKRLVGGCITPTKVRTGCRPCWVWKLNGGRQTLATLREIVDLMKCPEKIRRARHLIDNYESVTPRNGYYTDTSRVMKRTFEEAFFSQRTTIRQSAES